MASRWYYTKEGRQMEPVSSYELKQMARTGILKATDLIWKEGMPQWVQAGSANNLFPSEIVASPPPVPVPEAAPDHVRDAGYDVVPEFEALEVVDDLQSPKPSSATEKSKESDERPVHSKRRSREGTEVKDDVDVVDEMENEQDVEARPRRKKKKKGIGDGVAIALGIGGFVTFVGVIVVSMVLVLKVVNREGDRVRDNLREVVRDDDGNVVKAPAPVIRGGSGDVLHVNDHLTNNDPFDKVKRSCHCKIYTCKLTAGRTYTIDMESEQLDAFLRLEDANGVQLALDDDSGEDLNARIIFRAPRDGEYRIIATTFAPGMRGAFLLRVR
ncbi:MAG: DUF4339 domain-containing protein [Planctomycetes bacterium]|nr:DUF4339 domain-containing protein [Planctomycetota bacterium]